MAEAGDAPGSWGAEGQTALPVAERRVAVPAATGEHTDESAQPNEADANAHMVRYGRHRCASPFETREGLLAAEVELEGRRDRAELA